MTENKVYIIMVNWNGWQDTIECLESVLRNHYKNYRVIVCDNGSEDGSLEKIKQWAVGAIPAYCEANACIQLYTQPPITKPLQYIEYDRIQAEQGGTLGNDPQLILIRIGANLGFAGGNNVGMRYALARNDFEYVWLLNNDTVIEADALVNLVVRLREHRKYGICGSTLLYYDQPFRVQGLGGAKYNKWLGTCKHIGIDQLFSGKINENVIERKIDYIIGASMLVSKSFLTDVGLLTEDYFLYFEEIDWTVRCKNQYSLIYASRSLVFHKAGRSMASGRIQGKRKSYIADYYTVKNRILFTKRYFPYALGTVYLGFFTVIFNRLRHFQWDRVIMMIKIAVNGL